MLIHMIHQVIYNSILATHTTWNVSHLYEIHLTCPAAIEPKENIWKIGGSSNKKPGR